jgi:imidazoleglycerol-phosphate dehydratase/histidinol-phosphatase
MKRKLLFVDRDGCLIEEPADEQIDRYEKLALLPNVIPALRCCVEAGFELVMVTNQDGLGTESLPQVDFDGPHALLMRILKSQGVYFGEVLINASFPHQGRNTRKPGTGLVQPYLADDRWSRQASAMVGDRDTDMQFADNIGVRGFRVGKPDGLTWMEIAHRLCDLPRIAQVERNTRETRIRVRVDLDDTLADAQVSTGIGYFDHMLEQFGKHGGFALSLVCEGDLHVDEHHTVEDCGLALGQALREAMGDKRGIQRYGFVLPMDEAQASAVLDLSGRPYFVLEGAFPREQVGGLHVEMVEHFFRSLSAVLGANLHLAVRGDNAHHMIEACFKVVARALRQALHREGEALPSTKGVL